MIRAAFVLVVLTGGCASWLCSQPKVEEQDCNMWDCTHDNNGGNDCVCAD